jgi:hypothetical protein
MKFVDVRRNVFILIAALVLCVAVGPVRGDTFTLVSDAGVEFEVEARLAGVGQGIYALEMPDGKLLLVPDKAVKNRVEGSGPEPLSHEAVAADLQEEFGADRLRVSIDKPYVIGLVLDARSAETLEDAKIRSVLAKAGRFMNNMQHQFLQFVKQVRLKAQPLRYPLVVLIFESDREFDRYAREVTGNQGISAGAMSGFYDSISNYLVLRLSECATFEVPLHESIHQQVYNRQIFERLAPIPVWFNEGLATAFEGDGQRLRRGPGQVSPRYAQLALGAQRVNWLDVVQSDRPFGGDVLAGEAYGHAWGLHWLLVTRYKTKYPRYVQLLAAKKTLEADDPAQRLKEFEEAIGKSVSELQAEFQQAAPAALRRKR